MVPAAKPLEEPKQVDQEEPIPRHIYLDPHRPSLDEARLVDYGVSVWALIGYLRAVDGDISQARTTTAYLKKPWRRATGWVRRA